VSALNIVLLVLASLAFAYFAVLNTLYLVFTVIASRSVARYFRSRPYAASADALASPLTPGISVIVPAFNEEAGIVESVWSLLALRYPLYEVVVVNDGSSDATIARLHDEFDLVPVERVLRGAISYEPVRAIYLSRRVPALCVIDKENGGKADALNAGVDAARHPYVCAVDADALLEEDALLQVVKPILDDPDLVVATGGIVRIANGCRIDHGRVVEVRLPRSRLATLQVVEYFRAFLVGRVGWSRLNALLIISGAFGLFQRSLVEAVGGYSTKTVSEDVELVLRLHRYLRERGEPYRIEFVASPVCWTETPEDLRSLSAQRRRWQRGLGESLWRHRRMIGNRQYGTLGLVALPFFLLFEFLGPLVEAAGPFAALGAFALGRLSLPFLIAFLTLSVFLAILLSVAALALEEFSFRRYARGREIARLVAYAVLENLGYRQLVALWRTLALVDLLRRKKGWGAQRRHGFATSPVTVTRGPFAEYTSLSPPTEPPESG
jgi:cellulose synthase/poly-beta-1,6-N-acetylglucosamine synthase-like glycosyltransferase